MRGFWISFRLLVVALAAFLFLDAPALAQAVQQSGPVTGFHVPAWASNGYVMDGGSVDAPAVNNIGIFGGANCPLGISSQTGPGVATTPYGLFTVCQSATATTLNISGVNGNATPTLHFVIGGVDYPFPGSSGGGTVTGPVSSIVNDLACWNSTNGVVLKDCGTGSALTTTGPYPGQVAQALPAALQPDCLGINSYTSAVEQAKVVAGTSTLDYAPILEAAAASVSVNIADFGSAGFYAGTNRVCFGAGKYNFSRTVNLKTTVDIGGTGASGNGGFGAGTRLNWTTNTTGIIVNSSLTFGSTTVSPGTGSATGSVIHDLAMTGPQSGSGDTNYGVWLRAKATLRNLLIYGFSGNQINIVATAGSGGATEGNDNGFLIDTVTLNGFPSAVNGVYIAGADTNAGSTRNVNCDYFKSWCIDDASFLGDTHVAPEANEVGLASYVNYSGTSYIAHPTTTTTLLGSTTPGTDGTVWVATDAGSHPTWVSSPAGTYYPGGSYASTDLNARSVWIGAYAEGGYAPSCAGQQSLVLGGISAWASYCSGSVIQGSSGFTLFQKGVRWSGTNASPSEVFTVTMGGDPAAGQILDVTSATNWPNDFRWRFMGADMRMDYAGSDGQVYGRFTGPNTAFTAGRSTTQPYNFINNRFFIPGPTDGAYRSLSVDASLPSTTGHAPGEIVVNRTAATNAPMCWMETTQGTPDTWTPCPSLAGALTTSGYTMSTARLLGRTTASTGAVEQITVGTGLTLSGGSLTTSTLSGTSGSIGGGALLAGACANTTVSITGLTTGMAIAATPATYPGDGFYWDAYESSANTATVRVCAAVAGTPSASTYNLRALP